MSSEYTDIRDILPDWSTMQCWNCGHEERISPNRRMRICHHCFMDNSSTEHDGEYAVEGPDGDLYTDYRLLWYGDVSYAEAQRQYESSTKDMTERFKRSEAWDREINL